MTELLLERHGGVTLATLNRPEKHNALTQSLADSLEAAVADFNRDPDQRVLVITGAGDKAFSSGADLSEMKEGLGQTQRLPMVEEPDISGLLSCEKPVIAAINGLAVGGGLEITLCCDIRLASDNAWFGLPEVGHGFIAGIASVTLARLMPIGAVMDMMLVGDRVSAAEAHRLGLVQHLLPAGELMAETMRRAERIATHSPAALWGTKQVLRFWRDRMLEEQQRYYEAVIHRVLLSGDYIEGVKAFNDKRKPVFSNGWPDPLAKR